MWKLDDLEQILIDLSAMRGDTAITVTIDCHGRYSFEMPACEEFGSYTSRCDEPAQDGSPSVTEILRGYRRNLAQLLSEQTNQQTESKHMSLDEAAARTGGTWVKLESKGDELSGIVVEIDTEKERRDPKGNVVLSKKTNKPRKVFGLVIQTEEREGPDDDGRRKYDANESAQYAILDAFKAWRKDNPSGGVEGCKFKLGIAEEKKDEYDQHTYRAKFGERVVSLDDLAKPAEPEVEEPW